MPCFPRRPLSLLFAIPALVLLGGCDSGMNPDQPDVRRVDQSPAWSPSGDRIAYVHRAGPTEDTTDVSGLYVLDLEADSTWLVTEGRITSPDWRPDGKRIAFAAGDIFSVRPDGSDLRQITDHGSAFFPSWAPDGERLAYDATSLPKKGIWLVDPDGSNRKNLGLGREADWSSSGGQITYRGPPGETDSENQIWTSDTTGMSEKQLTDNSFVVNRHPEWSPNGDWVAWVAADGPEDDPYCQLRIMQPDGSDMETVTECGVDPIGWSPNSRQLVFGRKAAESPYTALWTIRRDGSDLRQITFPSRNPLN